MVRIGRCTLIAGVPRIVAIVDEFIDPDRLLRLKSQIDILEMRVDCYRKPVDKVVGYIKEVREKTALPMIGTVRENDYTKYERPAIFRAIMPFVDCIDIELGASISEEVLNYAKGKTVIVSEHDFEKTPDEKALENMVERSVSQGADIVKIAAAANCREDVVRMMQFVLSRKEHMVVISMGAIGTISRVIAPLFGSLFTYGYLTKPVAPGQIQVMELVEEIRKYFPR